MGRELVYDLGMINALSERVELAKRELPAHESTSVLFSSSDEAFLSLRVTRGEFDLISQDLYTRVLSPIDLILNKANLLGVKVDEVAFFDRIAFSTQLTKL